MTIFLMISLVILAMTSGYVTRVVQDKRAVEAKKKETSSIEGPSPKSRAQLSMAGVHVTDKFNKLPDEHRPALDIYEICRALDVKFGAAELNQHFTKYEFNEWNFSAHSRWLGFHGCECYKGAEYVECPYAEYAGLAEQMEELQNAVKEQERVLELAEHADGMREAKTLMEILDESVHVVRSVTEEVSARVESN